MLFTHLIFVERSQLKIGGDLGHKSFHGSSCSVYIDMMDSSDIISATTESFPPSFKPMRR